MTKPTRLENKVTEVLHVLAPCDLKEIQEILRQVKIYTESNPENIKEW
jgi:hypothetical protein